MKTQRIELGLLRASAQPRPLQTADVDKLAASIREVGLIQPVTVRSVSAMHNGLVQRVFQIVAGHHRVAAARALGWTEIDAVVVQAEGRLEAELIEIDENLCRSELSVAQRAHYSKRRKEIWEALHPEPSVDYGREDGEEEMGGTTCPTHPETDALGRKKSPQQAQSFAAATAEVTGQSKRDINRNVARAEAIGDDLLRLTGTSLDKGVELDALAKLPEPERKELIERAVAGEAVTARVTPQPTPAPTEAPTAMPTPFDDNQNDADFQSEGLTGDALMGVLDMVLIDLLNQSRYSCMDELVAAIRELPEDSCLQDVLQDFGRLANARK